MTRTYRQRRRAERQEQTRQRIVEAMVELHQEVGPSRTTISAIAERANVQRLTVYRHFPDERAMLIACSSLFVSRNPLPDPSRWGSIADADERLRVALDSFYLFYAQTHNMLEKVFRDAEESPILQEINQPVFEYLALVQRDLVNSWQFSPDRRDLVVAAVGHALDFQTWKSFVLGQGLSTDSLIDLMASLVAFAASGTPEGTDMPAAD